MSKEKSGKKRGGQPGHAGHQQELYPPEQCQRVEEHYPQACWQCGSVLSGGFSGFGMTLLGNGNDIVKGFGSGNFDGGRGKDSLELTSGSYTVGISGTTVSFMSNGITMNTFEFEKLIAGSTTFEFTGLSNGQTITIA